MISGQNFYICPHCKTVQQWGLHNACAGTFSAAPALSSPLQPTTGTPTTPSRTGTPTVPSWTGTPALAVQEGGDHYKAMRIQPFEYIHANGIPFAEGCIIKYVNRWRAKGGIEDLKKARHLLDLLIEAEQSK